MPIAATGPSALFEFRSEKSRHRTPTMTVPPEARIGSTDPRSAARVAPQPVRWSRRASRNRAV